MSIWEALPILKNGILASLIAAIICSYLGVYVILKRMVFMTAAVSQISTLGVAMALPLQLWLWTDLSAGAQESSLFPVMVAILLSVSAALLMARQGKEHRLTRESILGVTYVVPIALALLILDSTGGTLHDVNNLLFGNTVFVPSLQLYLLAFIAAVVAMLHTLLYKEFVFISFDQETAKTFGMPATPYSQLLFASLAMMISVSITVIGVLPVFSFIVLPSAIALSLTTSLGQAFLVSVLIGATSVLLGFYFSFVFSLPTGPAIIMVEALFFVIVILKSLLSR